MQKYFNIKCGLDAQTAKLKHKPKKINFGVVDVKGGAHGRLVPVNIANGLNRMVIVQYLVKLLTSNTQGLVT